MRTLQLLIFAALVSLAVAVGFHLVRSSPGTSNAATNAANEAQVRLEHTLAELAGRVDKLAQQVEQQNGKAVLSAPAAERLPLGEIDAAVARALATHAATNPESADKVAGTGHPQNTALDLHAVLAELRNPELSREERIKKWNAVAEAGKLDELIALYEQQAKDDPNNPKAQTSLGLAYLEKIFHGAAGPEAGVWGMKADKSFDHALELDDHDWEARFTKAVSLSNWPAFLGKQGEAIKNFETLVSQQNGQPSKPEYAQTYLILGNMYQETGHADKALSIWQQGAALFPDNQTLAQQIANAPGH